MKRFTHINAGSIESAVAYLSEYPQSSYVIAGGSDLMGGLKDHIWMDYPQAIINLKTIPGLSYIKVGQDGLRLGALTTLTHIAESAQIKQHWPALAQAAQNTASPLLRNMGTIGGNICQENRCWYYRYPHKLGGRINCIRKGGDKCLAVPGDHRYHSIFGAVNKCIAVNPSDTAPAIIALGGVIQTTKRSIPVEEFFSATNGKKSTVLEHDEIVTELFFPSPVAHSRSAFKKIAFRKSIDFALVNCAATLQYNAGIITSARICLNGVFNNPVRCQDAEKLLQGVPLTLDLAEQVAAQALEKAKPLFQNTYKVKMAQTLMVDTLLQCNEEGAA